MPVAILRRLHTLPRYENVDAIAAAGIDAAGLLDGQPDAVALDFGAENPRLNQQRGAVRSAATPKIGYGVFLLGVPGMRVSGADQSERDKRRNSRAKYRMGVHHQVPELRNSPKARQCF